MYSNEQFKECIEFMKEWNSNYYIQNNKLSSNQFYTYQIIDLLILKYGDLGLQNQILGKRLSELKYELGIAKVRSGISIKHNGKKTSTTVWEY